MSQSRVRDKNATFNQGLEASFGLSKLTQRRAQMLATKCETQVEATSKIKSQ